MRLIILLSFALTAFALPSSAQTTLTSNDSIKVFYDSLFHFMETEFLNKNEINWQSLREDTERNLDHHKNFQSSLQEINKLFEKAKASHCQVFYQDKSYSTLKQEPSEEDFSEQWIKKYASYEDGKFEVKLLDDKYAYIFLPGWNFEDISEESIHQIAQPLYDQLNALKQQYAIEGWIIDLRLNFGGNVYPMLLGLYDLLGNGEVWGSLNPEGQLINHIRLINGTYLDNNQMTSYIIPDGERMAASKVAIVMSSVTASSGEIVAMSFKGRKNTIFIGQDTYGATTSNDKRDLPFGAFMALTTGIDCDRNQNTYETIKPDVYVLKRDNFDKLMEDENIIEAIKYFKGK